MALLLWSNNIYARTIWVSLYNNRQIRSVVASAYNGRLTVWADDSTEFTIPSGQAIYAHLHDRKIWISDINGPVGSFHQLIVQGADSSSVVRLRPVSPQLEARNYEATISLTADVDRIQMINRIDEERYLAGVVEAETGQGRASEFYKAQAILCRTYLYGHIDRHENEGFHLCDEVHCQAYKGQCRSPNTILQAVVATENIILADRATSQPIMAAYHSNCGGATESAQNVWHNNLPYLVPVTDTYCTSMPNARWQRTISLDEWKNYLTKNGYKASPNAAANFSFRQTRRTPNYRVNNFTLPVRTIRNDWQLRSTFFSISIEGGNAVFRGRGYGHGVGLCQEGAMVMGRRGFKYSEIINFYFKNVNMVNVNNLQINVPKFENSD